jgi:hypothetical protein
MTLRNTIQCLGLLTVIPLALGCSSSGGGAAPPDSAAVSDGNSRQLDSGRDGGPGSDLSAAGHAGAAEAGGADSRRDEPDSATGGLPDLGNVSPADAPTSVGDLRDAVSGDTASAPGVDAVLRDASPTEAASAPGAEAGAREVGSSPYLDAAVDARDATPVASTGSVVGDRLAVAAASCGPQSFYTVPNGWQMVFAGESGCAFYAPAGWSTIGAGTPMTFAVEDSTRVTGSSVLAGVDTSGTATCTPHGVASWMFASNKDCVGFQELYWKDGVDLVAGLQIPKGDLIYSCTQSGVPIVGYMVVQIHGTWPFCNILAVAFWMPQTQIETRTCTLTQTLNSLQCPTGGSGCQDASCRSECIANGNQSGACTSDGSCTCTN